MGSSVMPPIWTETTCIKIIFSSNFVLEQYCVIDVLIVLSLLLS